MSTRSGKRLHNSSNENIEPEFVKKRDKKSRSKRVVENVGQEVLLKGKKRQNYVSFPNGEESADANSLADETQAKPFRALRRNTLKEQNAAPEEIIISAKKLVRSTRRTKKFSETITDGVLETPQNEDPVEVVTITCKPKGKKSKKKSKKNVQSEIINKENDVKVVKKKINKQKKNSQSQEQEQKVGKKDDESNVSTDSFHSAAGSPDAIILPPLTKSSPIHAAETLCVSGNKKRRSSLKRTSDLNTSTKISMDVVNTNIENGTEIVNVRESKRRSSLKAVELDKGTTKLDPVENGNLNTTFETEPTNEGSNKKKRKSNLTVETNNMPIIRNSSNLDNPETFTPVLLNTTFEKDEIDVKNKKSKESYIKEQANVQSKHRDSSFEKRVSPRKSVNAPETITTTPTLDSTFDLSPKPIMTKQKSLDSTFDKKSKLDSTFDKTTKKPSFGSKSSLISSDATNASNSSLFTLDKSDEYSKISITDDDSKTENILNTTPLLIESSMEESKVMESSLKENKTLESQPKLTPLKREGTFTKDAPEVSISPKLTPNKIQTLPTAGCTPYHSNGKGSQKRSILNVTHSIEKPSPPSSRAEPPRSTRVMFCSPVNNPGVATQRKSKIIKSNLKGSNKSFVFDKSDASPLPARSGRKRSFTHAAGEAGAGAAAKRSRLAPAPATPAPAALAPATPAPATTPERRARTSSAMAKLTSSATPAKAGTPQPAKPRSELKATRLPNFAALHARRFERMESLDECQQRRARRARQLLVPTGSVAVLERSSPRGTLDPKPRDTPPKAAIPAKSASKLPTLETLQPGYTRFGFKMHCDVNPFCIPTKTTEKPKETKPNGLVKPIKKSVVSLKRQAIQPSLAGATSLRREAAKQTIMREKSFTLAEKRNEVRTVIKGVRTNRRFELQMRSRNLNG